MPPHSDLDHQIDRLRRCELITEDEVENICQLARDVLMEEGNIQNINSPITLCGDVHGQFFDLMEIFQIGGDAPHTQYLFLGDYVDRGYYSVETLLLLLALKVRYPDRMMLIRGNHESRQITSVYGFYDECMKKYGSAHIWHLCADVFDYLPLGALIDNEVLCVHGGLSPELESLDQVRMIDRKQEVPHTGLMCDLLWSDPDCQANDFTLSPRGAGYLFGEKAINEFGHANKISLLCRAHQLVMEGFKWHFNKRVLTIWSAPNYCYRCGNIASLFEYHGGAETPRYTFKMFREAPQEERAIPTRPAAPDYFL
eukprot:m.40448 g.40448  ORF g.40448 m.40448 type:complete len:312 (+) comp10354_c0_seq2:39-974(+)